MRHKTFLVMFMALVLAPGLIAQTDSDPAHWQFAQAMPAFPAIPQRRITPRGNIAVPTNSPASVQNRARNATGVPAFPGFPAAPAPGASPRPGAIPAVAPEALSRNGEVANISYNFPGIPIKQLLDIYADLVGRTLLRATSGPEAVPDTTTIVLNTQSKLTRSEAIVALETILGMNGVTIIPIGDKFDKVVTEAVAPASGGEITTNTNNLPEAGKFVTQIVQVKYADPKDLVDVLAPFSRAPKSIIVVPSTETLILRDYAENVARMMEMVAKIDVLTPNSIKPEIIPIKYALASDIASALSALGASGGTSVGKSTSGASYKGPTGTIGNSGGGGSFGGGGGIGGSGGGYPGQSTQGSTSGLGSSATSGRSSFQQNLSRIVNNAQGGGQGNFNLFGQTKIIADERTNSLLVFANDEDMKMIKTIINKLDVVLAQVLIDAIIMEINLEDTRNTGISYGTQNGRASQFSGVGGLNNLSSAASGFLNGSSTNGAAGADGINSTLTSLPGGFSYFGKYGNDIDLVLEAVAGNSRINVLSRPRIQTSHAVEADLFIGNTVPYVTGTYNNYGSGPSSQYTQLEVGISLQVTPLINPEGLVVMDIAVDVEQLGPDVQITGVGGVPTTTKRQAGAKVAVRSGETIILGGFISDSRSKSISGIPGLMNIPGLGNLFRTTSIENLRTELIMLMRPTVLPTPEVAAVVATEERNKLSGVKQAELEIRQDEARRNAKIDQEMAEEAAQNTKLEAKEAKREAKKHHTAPMNTSTSDAPVVVPGPAVEDQ